jgi:hypothetical protein
MTDDFVVGVNHPNRGVQEDHVTLGGLGSEGFEVADAWRSDEMIDFTRLDRDLLRVGVVRKGDLVGFVTPVRDRTRRRRPGRGALASVAWLQDLRDVEQAAGIGSGPISRQTLQDLHPARPGQDVAQSAHGGVLERVVQAGEEVVFLDERHEVQPELKRRRLDADSDIGHAARDTQPDGDVRVLDMVGVTRPAPRRNRVLVHQVLDQHSSARALLSIYEAQVVLDDVA